MDNLSNWSTPGPHIMRIHLVRYSTSARSGKNIVEITAALLLIILSLVVKLLAIKTKWFAKLGIHIRGRFEASHLMNCKLWALTRYCRYNTSIAFIRPNNYSISSDPTLIRLILTRMFWYGKMTRQQTLGRFLLNKQQPPNLVVW